jgi:hypothetical protein
LAFEELAVIVDVAAEMSQCDTFEFVMDHKIELDNHCN